MQTVAVLRRLLAVRSAELIRSDPEAASAALEVGLVDARWLEDPAGHPNVVSPAGEVLERFWLRAVEQRPSRLSTLGLGAVQLLGTLGAGGSGAVETITVVFTDLEGFTAYTDRHGDPAALELIHEHHRLAGPLVRRWGGKIVKHLGDGLLCTFADPDAALRAALDLLGSAPPPLRLRAGAHRGRAVVSRSDVLGQVVNLAARVTDTAAGGEIMITEELARSAGTVPGLRYGEARTELLKGIAEPVRICQVFPSS